MTDSGGGHFHYTRLAGRRRLVLAFVLIAAYMGVEIVGGIMSGSLALLADAGHMLTDVAAIGLALIAFWVAGRPPSIEQTFGWHRTEILAAMTNGLGLWLIAGWVFFEASQRFSNPQPVDGLVMLIIGVVGLLVNVGAASLLRHSAEDSLNVEGAFWHVLADLLGSIGVVAASVIVLTLGWTVVDAIAGVVIGILIMVSSFRLLSKVVHVLMEGTPSQLDLQQLCSRLEQLDGITGVHDIHAWTITTGYDAMSAHVTAEDSAMADPNLVLDQLRLIASTEFGIGHVTIQLESSMNNCSEKHHIEHLAIPWSREET